MYLYILTYSPSLSKFAALAHYSLQSTLFSLNIPSPNPLFKACIMYIVLFEVFLMYICLALAKPVLFKHVDINVVALFQVILNYYSYFPLVNSNHTALA